MLINPENVWGIKYTTTGDAKNLCGNISKLNGDITELSGCCSRIYGEVISIKKLTTDLNKIQDIINEYNLVEVLFFRGEIDNEKDYYTYTSVFFRYSIEQLTVGKTAAVGICLPNFNSNDFFRIVINNNVKDKLGLLVSIIEKEFTTSKSN